MLISRGSVVFMYLSCWSQNSNYSTKNEMLILLFSLKVEMKPGVGPVFDKPLETPADIDSLTIPDVKV